jgi:class 3 adenylate cyclase
VGRRKLLAVLYADMVGHRRLIGFPGSLARLRTLRGALIDPAIAEHGGRIVQTVRDSLLVAFDNIVLADDLTLRHPFTHPPLTARLRLIAEAFAPYRTLSRELGARFVGAHA